MANSEKKKKKKKEKNWHKIIYTVSETSHASMKSFVNNILLYISWRSDEEQTLETRILYGSQFTYTPTDAEL